MKISNYKSGDKASRILAAMIHSPQVIARILPRWKYDLFTSPEHSRIASWCIDHFKKYNKAPGSRIEISLADWAEKHPNEATIEMTDRILRQLDYQSLNGDLNVDHVIDQASEYFNEEKMKKTANDVLACLESGDRKKAHEILNKYSKIEMGMEATVDLRTNKEEVYSTFDHQIGEPMVKYGGELDLFFRNEMERGCFLVFTGPQKSSKSFSLIDLAHRAEHQRKRVAFFGIGDMNMRQVKERFLIRVAKHPTRSPNGRWPVSLKIPESMIMKGKIPKIQWENKEFKKPLDGKVAWQACEYSRNTVIKSNSPYLRLSCHSNRSITILDIKAMLDLWASKGWICDICVIDYMDNLAPIDTREETRDRVNTTWQMARGMCHESNICLVSATQVNVKGFSQKVLNKLCFSEDNRKLGHVTGMVGINVNAEEKGQGRSRWNWIVKREGEYSVNKVIHLAGCLGIANPAIKSGGWSQQWEDPGEE